MNENILLFCIKLKEYILSEFITWSHLNIET